MAQYHNGDADRADDRVEKVAIHRLEFPFSFFTTVIFQGVEAVAANENDKFLIISTL